MRINYTKENKESENLREPIFEYIGIDIGGSWLKGAAVPRSTSSNQNAQTVIKKISSNIVKVKSPLSEESKLPEFITAIEKIIEKLGVKGNLLQGIGISTAGVVDYAGRNILKAAAHLQVLRNSNWTKLLEDRFNCPVSVINDADAAAIGAAESGLLSGPKTIGIMPVGTGLGLSVWRNGRRWRPGKMLNLLGSIRTPAGYFDEIASASKLASLDGDNNLISVFTNHVFKEKRNEYLKKLADIINTAAIIYNLDEVMIGGGLAEAVMASNYPLVQELNRLLSEEQVELDKTINATILEQGNSLQLIGALSMAQGEAIARKNRYIKEYSSIPTEQPYRNDLRLEKLSTKDLIKTLWKAEQEAGEKLQYEIDAISEVVDVISKKINKGGRLIYVGAGTSGRIAAMDAVEIPCTYGLPDDKILCLIAGGIADAAIEIESDFEEDASAVPEMLLMNVSQDDSVIGISASGSAYYVQSALAFAKNRGAYSVLVQSEPAKSELPFCDTVIPLNSGFEVVAGSTRMKAGTATKKILNFISSSVMIKMGKVAGPYMIDVACLNNKLVERAQFILKTLYGTEKDKALEMLKEEGMDLSKLIHRLNQKSNSK